MSIESSIKVQFLDKSIYQMSKDKDIPLYKNWLMGKDQEKPEELNIFIKNALWQMARQKADESDTINPMAEDNKDKIEKPVDEASAERRRKHKEMVRGALETANLFPTAEMGIPINTPSIDVVGKNRQIDTFRTTGGFSQEQPESSLSAGIMPSPGTGIGMANQSDISTPRVFPGLPEVKTKDLSREQKLEQVKKGAKVKWGPIVLAGLGAIGLISCGFGTLVVAANLENENSESLPSPKPSVDKTNTLTPELSTLLPTGTPTEPFIAPSVTPTRIPESTSTPTVMEMTSEQLGDLDNGVVFLIDNTLIECGTNIESFSGIRVGTKSLNKDLDQLGITLNSENPIRIEIRPKTDLTTYGGRPVYSDGTTGVTIVDTISKGDKNVQIIYYDMTVLSRFIEQANDPGSRMSETATVDVLRAFILANGGTLEGKSYQWFYEKFGTIQHILTGWTD